MVVKKKKKKRSEVYEREGEKRDDKASEFTSRFIIVAACSFDVAGR